MKIGYARASTKEQTESIATQTRILRQAGCTKIFSETISGAKSKRPQLEAALSALSSEDILVVTRIDRLGRSTLDTLKTLRDLEQRGIRIQFLDFDLDSNTPMGKMVLSVLASLAEWERNLLIERTREGLAHAREQGRYGGRRRILNDEQEMAVMASINSGMSATQVSRLFGVSRSTVERIKARHRQ